jgi:hypothetical protein
VSWSTDTAAVTTQLPLPSRSAAIRPVARPRPVAAVSGHAGRG